MNKKSMLFLLLCLAAYATTKAQMTVGGSYKPSHTLVVKGQVKIDTVKSGSITDSLLTIGADSVLHRLPISSIADGSQTRVTAGTNTTVTGTGASVSPYVINSITPATSHTLGVSGNTLTSTVNGVSATAPVIGSVSTASTGNSLNTTVNGQTSSGANIINTNTSALTQAGGLVTAVNGVTATTPISAGTATNVLGFSSTGAPVYQPASSVLTGATTHTVGVSGNTLTSTVNGVSATAPVIGSVSAATTGNTLSTTVNGQTSTGVNIINTNANALTQAGGLVNTVNGVAATTPIAAGTAVNVLGFNSTGAPVYQTASSVLSGATTHTVGVSGNTLTSTVNGVAATAPVIGAVSNTSAANTLTTTVNGQSGTAVNIVNTNTSALTQTGGLVNTVNGVTATTAIPAGTAANVLGFSSTGAPVYQTAASVLGGATTNALGVTGNTLTSTVNGVAATSPLIGTISNTSTGNTLSTTINGQSGSTVNIVNANTNNLSQSAGLVTTVNGIAATTSIPTGTVSNVLGYSSTGTPVYQSASAVLSGTTTNTSSLTQAGGLVNTVNGVSATAAIPTGTVSNVLGYSSTGTPVYQSASSILSGSTTNTNALSQTGGLVTTVDGVVATTAIPSGTASNLLGYSSTGTPVYQSPASVLAAATTNTVTTTSGTLTSTVNGKVATAPVLISASNGLTATSGNVALGGALTAATTITGAANKLSITSTATDGFAVDGTTLSVDAANHRVGFGTAAPATSLDVRGATAGTALRMADGSQGAGKVLVSDASGNASWNTFTSNANAVIGSLNTNSGNNLLLQANNYTGASITLPPGKWAVSVTMTIAIASSVPTIPSGSSIWVRSTLSSSSTSIDTTNLLGNGKLVSGGATGPIDYGVVSGNFWVNNTSGANKTYYYWQVAGNSYSSVVTLNLGILGNVNLLSGNTPTAVSSTRLNAFGTTAWGEDQIVAVPIN